jgi:hypothetical protein
MEGSRRFLLPLVLVGIFSVIGLFRLGLIDRVAPGIAFAAPVLACGAAAVRALRRGARGGLPIAALLVCTALAAELAVNQGVRAELPPPVEISHSSPGRLEAPGNTSTLDVFVVASVSSSPGAQGSAEIELSRGGRVEVMKPAFSRAVTTTRSGRRSRVGAGAAHDEERFRVELPGQGPIDARLLHVAGAIGTAVRISAAPVPRTMPMVETAMVLAGLGIVLWDSLQRDRAGRVAHLSGSAAAFAFYLERWFSPNDAVSGVFSAAIVAAIGAAAIAIATALLARAVSRLRSPAGGS